MNEVKEGGAQEVSRVLPTYSSAWLQGTLLLIWLFGFFVPEIWNPWTSLQEMTDARTWLNAVFLAFPHTHHSKSPNSSKSDSANLGGIFQRNHKLEIYPLYIRRLQGISRALIIPKTVLALAHCPLSVGQTRGCPLSLHVNSRTRKPFQNSHEGKSEKHHHTHPSSFSGGHSAPGC